MKCRVYSCWREAAEGSEFCEVKHGWNEKTKPKRFYLNQIVAAEDAKPVKK